MKSETSKYCNNTTILSSFKVRSGEGNCSKAELKLNSKLEKESSSINYNILFGPLQRITIAAVYIRKPAINVLWIGDCVSLEISEHLRVSHFLDLRITKTMIRSGVDIRDDLNTARFTVLITGNRKYSTKTRG